MTLKFVQAAHRSAYTNFKLILHSIEIQPCILGIRFREVG